MPGRSQVTSRSSLIVLIVRTSPSQASSPTSKRKLAPSRSPRLIAVRMFWPSGESGRSSSKRRPRCSSNRRSVPDLVRPRTSFGRMVQERTHVCIEHAGEGAGRDLLAVPAEVLAKGVVEGGVAEDGATAGVQVLDVDVDRPLLGCADRAHAIAPFVVCRPATTAARSSSGGSGSRFSSDGPRLGAASR